MPRSSFNLPQLKWKDPRVAMRVILGVLLLANLAAAVVAFHPFGGGAEDLRRQQQTLQQQLIQLNSQVKNAQQLATKVRSAREAGDEFMEDYVTEARVVTSALQSELFDMAKVAGVAFLPTTFTKEAIEGSDTLAMYTINAGCTGTYPNIVKFLNLIDKSDRFLIIESLVAQPQQTGQNLTLAIKINTFTKGKPGDDAL